MEPSPLAMWIRQGPAQGWQMRWPNLAMAGAQAGTTLSLRQSYASWTQSGFLCAHLVIDCIRRVALGRQCKKVPHGSDGFNKSVRRNKLLYVRDALANHVLNLLGQWSVAQSGCFALSVIEHPPHEIGEDLSLGGVSGVSGDQEPGKAGDRIRVRTRRVGDGDAIVGGHVFRGTGGGGSDTIGRCLYEFACGVADCTEFHLVLDCVDQLDIANGVRGLTNHAGDAFVSFLADACRPFDGSTLAYLAVPVRADLGEKIRKDE